MNGDQEPLRLFLTWVFGGGGAMVMTYWIMERWPWAAGLDSFPKRVLSLVMAAVLACVAFLLTVLFRYNPAPADWIGWSERMFAVAFLAMGGSQLIHGDRKLRRRG